MTLTFISTIMNLSQLKENIDECEFNDLDIGSRSVIKRFLYKKDSFDSTDLIRIDGVLDYMYEQINIGNWREVKQYLRKTITVASYLKLLIYLQCSATPTQDGLREAFKIIDFGLIFGCPLISDVNLLQKCATLLNSLTTPSNIISNPLVSLSYPNTNNTNSFGAIPLDIINCPSMESFYRSYILSETPVVLDNCINNWPALKKWQDQSYFLQLAGLRTVSIEIGSKYTDVDWTQKLMTLEEFIKNYIYKCDGPVGYLAQYQLFEQIPELKKDIAEPEYCCFSDSEEPVDIMAWFGPKGTVSPLHHDPKKNLLAQVVGEKQIFLFSPNDSEYLYCHEHELLNNTARVDPRNPDFAKYPEYKNAKAYYCVLSPGQLLYIPPKWWHFVESLSTSFSVSFWWE